MSMLFAGSITPKNPGSITAKSDNVYYGRAEDRLAQRHTVLQAAYAAHPERFPHGLPRPQLLPAATYINPPSHAHAVERNDRVVVGCVPGTLTRDAAQAQ